jgi:hypothetical protein
MTLNPAHHYRAERKIASEVNFAGRPGDRSLVFHAFQEYREVDDKLKASAESRLKTLNKAKKNAVRGGFPEYRALKFFRGYRSLPLLAGKLAAKQRHTSEPRGQQNK